METYIAEGCEGVPRNTMCCITMHFNAFLGSRRLFKGRDLKPTKSTDAGPNSGWRWSDTSLCICLTYWLKVAVLSKTCHPKLKHVSLAFRLLISDLFAKCRRLNPRCHAAATESVTDTVRAPWCDFFNQNLWAIWFKSNKSCQDFGIFQVISFISHLISQLISSDLKSLVFDSWALQWRCRLRMWLGTSMRRANSICRSAVFPAPPAVAEIFFTHRTWNSCMGTHHTNTIHHTISNA